MTEQVRTPFLVVVVCVFLLLATIGVFSASLSRGGAGVPGDEISEDADAGYHRLHDAGVTGKNVSVGVVDVTGFDTTDPAFSNRVVAARAFGSGATVENHGRNAHGTAATSVVARVAPDANLYLAAFESPDSYRQAVEWLVEADVDVIVAPVTFYGKPGDGTARVDQVATDAVRQGVVFVTPAGNLARGHWTGQYESVDDATLQFEGDSKNYLRGGGREVILWLSWDRSHWEDDFTVELHRTDGQETRVVARSQPYLADDIPNERIVASPQAGTYFFVVRGPPNATGARLTLESPTHDFQHARSSGSIASPATARGALSVGAYDDRVRAVEPFSSHGPTSDGRLGVDVLAPDRHESARTGGEFVGSSASAPYVGGVVALMLADAPCLSPRQVEQRLERTAADIGSTGVDFATGHGTVRPGHAVRSAQSAIC